MWKFIAGVLVGGFAGGFLTQLVIGRPMPPAVVTGEVEVVRARVVQLEAERIEVDRKLADLREQAAEVRGLCERCGPRDR